MNPLEVGCHLWLFDQKEREEWRSAMRSDEEALRRELKERLGVNVKVGACTMFVKQQHDDYTLDFYVYQCELPSDQIPRALKVLNWKWVHPHEMESYPFPPADAQTTRRLIAQEGDDEEVN